MPPVSPVVPVSEGSPVGVLPVSSVVVPVSGSEAVSMAPVWLVPVSGSSPVSDGLAEAVREGNDTMQSDALNRERYYFDDQVANDMAEQQNMSSVKGQPSLTDKQWRYP